MSFRPFRIDPDIRRARMPPVELYRDSDWWQALCERVFPRSWQLSPAARFQPRGNGLHPWTLLPGCLDEALLLARDENDRLRCLSNVCTHRGMPLVEKACAANSLRCPYHGRQFDLQGRLQASPEFEAAENFPSEEDDLPRAAVGEWQGFSFAAVHPKLDFERWIETLNRPTAPWLNADWPSEPTETREYEVEANWALYMENALEGFHLPWVHRGLSKSIDFASYRTELFASGNIQVAEASQGEAAFDLPAKHPDAGKRIAGYFAFLFPNLMFNFYPWGLSINLIHPRGMGHCRVTYLTFVCKPELRGQGAGGDLDTVELEDGAAVAKVQQGIRSRLFQPGRYSPSREAGLHQFHRLLAEYLCGHEPMPRVIDT